MLPTQRGYLAFPPGIDGVSVVATHFYLLNLDINAEIVETTLSISITTAWEYTS
jgi:hypothetical protein